MDGGVRQGTDVLKALALEARAVFIGRPVLWGLACNREEGVTDQVLEILREEFKSAMMLSGTMIAVPAIFNSHIFSQVVRAYLIYTKQSNIEPQELLANRTATIPPVYIVDKPSYYTATGSANYVCALKKHIKYTTYVYTECVECTMELHDITYVN